MYTGYLNFQRLYDIGSHLLLSNLKDTVFQGCNQDFAGFRIMAASLTFGNSDTRKGSTSEA